MEVGEGVPVGDGENVGRVPVGDGEKGAGVPVGDGEVVGGPMLGVPLGVRVCVGEPEGVLLGEPEGVLVGVLVPVLVAVGDGEKGGGEILGDGDGGVCVGAAHAHLPQLLGGDGELHMLGSAAHSAGAPTQMQGNSG